MHENTKSPVHGKSFFYSRETDPLSSQTPDSCWPDKGKIRDFPVDCLPFLIAKARSYWYVFKVFVLFGNCAAGRSNQFSTAG